MAKIALKDVRKVYGSNIDAIKGVSMEIDDGEMIVLVGPSGCGKSTLLRMIAGLESISGGQIMIDGRVVNDLEPSDRDSHGFPELRALSAHDGAAEPCLWFEEPEHPKRRNRSPHCGGRKGT